MLSIKVRQGRIADRIRKRISERGPGPTSKILFASVETSPYMAIEAMRTGAHGYLVKANAGRELLPALRTVCQDERFLSDTAWD
jgi:DNA-binding NarL/FixJ family response regulator